MRSENKSHLTPNSKIFKGFVDKNKILNITSPSKNQKHKTPKLRLSIKLTRVKYLVKDVPFTDKIIDGFFICFSLIFP